MKQKRQPKPHAFTHAPVQPRPKYERLAKECSVEGIVVNLNNNLGISNHTCVGMKTTTETKAKALRRCHEQWKKRNNSKQKKKEITTDTHNIKFNIKLYINTDDGKRKKNRKKSRENKAKKKQEKAENI